MGTAGVCLRRVEEHVKVVVERRRCYRKQDQEALNNAGKFQVPHASQQHHTVASHTS